MKTELYKLTFIITLVLFATLNIALQAKPIITEEAKKYETIFTTLVVEKDNKKIVVINRIIKGKVDNLTFELAKLQADAKLSIAGGDLLFFFTGDKKKIVTSVVEKNGSFSYTIDGKLLKSNITELTD